MTPGGFIVRGVRWAGTESKTESSRTITPVLAGSLAAAATVCLLVSRRRRREKGLADAAAIADAERICRACEVLSASEDVGATALCNDALGHVACEGGLFIAYERPIDYGRRDSVDPRAKIDKWRAAPMALLPAPVERFAYATALETSRVMCKMLDAIATDYVWLERTFSELARIDEWTGKMLKLARLDDGGRRIRCHCVRADFMVEAGRLMNIEINAYAASLAGQAEAVSDTHRRLLAKYLGGPEGVGAGLDLVAPPNRPCAGLANSLASAAKAYVSAFSPLVCRPAIAVVSVAEEDNELDHRKLERYLFENHGFDTVRVTIAELIEMRKHEADLEEGQPLVLRLPGLERREIAVCYFRLCVWERYGLQGWRVREAIAKSRAVEVPSAATHLACLKRAQVEWSCKAGLDRLANGDALSSSEKDLIRRAALPQFALDTAASALLAQSAVSVHANRPFVCKPGRDGFGGGHPHIFDRSTVLKIATQACDSSIAGDARGWIVQACAKPRASPSLIVADTRDDRQPLVTSRPSIPELGIFVVGLYTPAHPSLPVEVIPARTVGHLVRSKHTDTKDGGLCRGNAVLDSPLLC